MCRCFLQSLVPKPSQVHSRVASSSDVCKVDRDMQTSFLNAAIQSNLEWTREQTRFSSCLSVEKVSYGTDMPDLYTSMHFFKYPAGNLSAWTELGWLCTPYTAIPLSLWVPRPSVCVCVCVCVGGGGGQCFTSGLILKFAVFLAFSSAIF